MYNINQPGYSGYYPQMRPNTLPQQQVIQVNGRSSVDNIALAPNSSILVMDTTAPIVWLCVSDGLGNVTSTPYDVTLHTETSPTAASPEIDAKLAELAESIAKLNERMAAYESDAAKPKSK